VVVVSKAPPDDHRAGRGRSGIRDEAAVAEQAWLKLSSIKYTGTAGHFVMAGRWTDSTELDDLSGEYSTP